MQKINSREFTRLIRAMERLAKEMDALHQEDVAGEIAVNGSELESAYKAYVRSLGQLNEQINRFHTAFDVAYVRYRLACRHKAQIVAKKRRAAKKKKRSSSPSN